MASLIFEKSTIGESPDEKIITLFNLFFANPQETTIVATLSVSERDELCELTRKHLLFTFGRVSSGYQHHSLQLWKILFSHFEKYKIIQKALNSERLLIAIKEIEEKMIPLYLQTVEA